MTRGRFRWKVFAGALAGSLLFHVFAVIPALLEPVAGLLKPRETLEEVALLDDVPADTLLPPEVEPTKAPDKDKEKRAEKPKEKPPEAGKIEEPKPKPEPPKPVEAQVTPPPPPPPQLDARKKMVMQDQFKDEADNADARYYAENNHRVEQDTRTESTNLVRPTTGAEHKSAPNDNRDKEAGEKDQVIAELQQHRGTDIPREAPQRGHEGQSADPKQHTVGPLSMRNLVPRTDQRAEQKQRDGVERQESATGELPMQRQGMAGERGGATKKGGSNVKLTLDHHAYDNIEGFATAQKERREAALAQQSHVRGHYDKYLDGVQALRSAMENFIPEVKVGNQAELGTRKNPFASYIYRVHTQIHKIFTFGFLQDQEMRAGRGPFDDPSLWTKLEIALNSDGTLFKVGVVRSSGNMAFDAVAIDSVRSAAPFPEPPSVIRSANGKVYLDWQFHRNEEACGTMNVEPHILTTPGDPASRDGQEPAGTQRPHGAESQATAPPAGAKPTLAEGEAPRRLQRSPEENSAPSAVSVPDVTTEVHNAAEGWFGGWARGDLSFLTGWSATPFQAGGKVVARDTAALKKVYQQMIAESSERGITGIEILTPGGIRAKIGSLPPGGEESNMLFATGQAKGERFVLLLKKSDQGWRVVGIVR